MGDEDRMHDMDQRLQRLERRETAAMRSRRLVDEVLPPKTREHLRNASREQLLAVRTMLDHWIRRLGDEGTDGDDEKRSRETIRIE